MSRFLLSFNSLIISVQPLLSVAGRRRGITNPFTLSLLWALLVWENPSVSFVSLRLDFFPAAHWWFLSCLASLSRGPPMLEAPTYGAPPVASTTPGQSVREYRYLPKTLFLFIYSPGLTNRSYPAPRLNFIPSQPIDNKIDPQMSAIKNSLASLKEATALAERIPSISPLAGALLQVLTMRNVSIRLHS